jgi:hypothetical protein
MSNARVTVTLPSEVLHAIDREEVNRSRFVLKAVTRELDLRRNGFDTGEGPYSPAKLPEVHAVAGERSELLARKHGKQKLSRKEQERVDLLTARLKELLPPVSVRDLENLLEMTEEVERIRERARERRRQLGLI